MDALTPVTETETERISLKTFDKDTFFDSVKEYDYSRIGVAFAAALFYWMGVKMSGVFISTTTHVLCACAAGLTCMFILFKVGMYDNGTKAPSNSKDIDLSFKPTEAWRETKRTLIEFLIAYSVFVSMSTLI